MTAFIGRPNEPFFWGKGGKRMAPEDIALQRRLAMQQQAAGMDFSPVASPLQGLARVAQGFIGGRNMRQADKAAAANAEESNAVLQALMAGGQPAEGAPDPVIAALTNPNVSEQVRELATMMWRDQHENPQQPYRTEDNAGNVWELGEGGFRPIFVDPNDRSFIQDGQLITVPNRVRTGGGGLPSGGEASLPTVTDEASYNALPPGAQYRDPQGNLRTKGGAPVSAAPPFAASALDEITMMSESGGDPGAVSPAGARGLMQVMPATARDPGFGIRPSNGTPQDDARVGREYRAKMQERYGGDLAKMWAAYNWGPGNLDEALQGYGENWLQAAPRETQDYVAQNLRALRGR